MSKYVEGINEERFDAFLSDLRSGNFKQGRAVLHYIDRYEDHTDERFCCLGVASELAHQDDAISKDDSFFEVRYGKTGALLSLETVQWLGLPEDSTVTVIAGEFNVKLVKTGMSSLSYTDFVTATELNDVRKSSFLEIADHFENEFKRQ